MMSPAPEMHDLPSPATASVEVRRAEGERMVGSVASRRIAGAQCPMLTVPER
jgi:hypothetical protein